MESTIFLDCSQPEGALPTSPDSSKLNGSDLHFSSAIRLVAPGPLPLPITQKVILIVGLNNHLPEETLNNNSMFSLIRSSQRMKGQF